jgi:riboflavin synthase
MFTGIVEELGRVVSLHLDASTNGWILVIQSPGITFEHTILGDSIAVNGVCLTVTHLDTQFKTFTFGCAPETMRRTNLGELKQDSFVNLERAVRAAEIIGRDRFGGHFVEGHVDGVGKILHLKSENESVWVRIQVSKEMARFIVEKGYIAVDGTSLTVCAVGEDWFEIMMVKYTQEHVVLGKKSVGESVNIELDILAKYVGKIAFGNPKDIDVQKVVSSVWEHVQHSLSK